MSLLLSSHYFSLSSKPPSHHRNNHRYNPRLLFPHLPQTLIFTLNPNKTPIYAAAAKPSTGDTKTLPKSAIQRIADKLRSLGFVEENPNSEISSGNEIDSKIGEVFVPNSRQIPIYRVGHTLDPSWSTPSNPVPKPGSGNAMVKLNELKKVAKKEWKEARYRAKEASETKVPSLAELSLSGSELRRLTTLGIKMKQKMNIGKAGITEGIINGIHERWRSSEVVKIVCEDISKLNMKRTHDLLERKSGGMVVWRAGSKIILYRGANYKYPYFSLDEASVGNSSENAMNSDDGKESHSSETSEIESSGQSSARVPGQSSLIAGVGSPDRVRLQLPGERELVEEADRLLDGLGPRFNDWWGYEPLPVDADLLPAVVPGFRKPFRLLPYGVKPQLTNDEMTILKRLGRPLPCHFALGRNRKHQGLAEAMLKLWEKCEIAKIAVKRGVQNTSSELMAEELKSLTGGVLLSRDKEYIVFYRGKDFLPAVVSSAIQERRKSRTPLSNLSPTISENDTSNSEGHASVRSQLGNVSPTIAENAASNSEGHASVNASENNKDQNTEIGLHERKTRSIEAAIVKTNRKLAMALDEKARAQKLLTELEQAEISSEAEIDKEGITEEEKYMLRKVGLKMRPFLLLGRRGVFDGTIENMHLHWKYRELVKIICGGWNIDEIHRVARTLEAESGGILVAVERVRKGHAIIVYRGKNYQRPASLRPQTLLNKKQALKRSIEEQRRQSLKLNVLKLSKNIQDLKLKLAEDNEALCGQTGQQLRPQMDVEEPVLTSAMSDDNNDHQKGHVSSVQDKLISIPNDTSEVADTSLILLGDTVQKEHTVRITHPSISAEPEVVEKPVLTSAVSEDNNDRQIGFVPPVLDKILSLPNDASEVVDKSSILSGDTVQIEHTSSYINPSISNEPEARFSGIFLPASSDSDKASRDGSLFNSTSYESDPSITVATQAMSKHIIFKDETISSARKEDVKALGPPTQGKITEKNPCAELVRARTLTNKERLLLRKEALTMKRRPVLAVGRSNVVTGVAKAIKDHFKKHPLAIVNVKGRAKGTSVKEIVFQLEEPNKVILYRGWGAGADRRSSSKEDRGTRAAKPSVSVSPELLAAMRIECGL
ncbi:hypothetical protein RND81_07G109300 [Saponaria officinalis]|uniref:CRM domain-containing protein n=1 Tax=Saponaria officinalis TaxID=3572 RepID=A0AAW1JSZ6_SAPOF